MFVILVFCPSKKNPITCQEKNYGKNDKKKKLED